MFTTRACMAYARVLECMNDYDAERWSWGCVESFLSVMGGFE